MTNFKTNLDFYSKTNNFGDKMYVFTICFVDFTFILLQFYLKILIGLWCQCNLCNRRRSSAHRLHPIRRSQHDILHAF